MNSNLKGKGKRLESRGRNMYPTWGGSSQSRGQRPQIVSSVQSRDWCPLACGLRQVSLILSLNFFLDKMGMMVLVTLILWG